MPNSKSENDIIFEKNDVMMHRLYLSDYSYESFISHDMGVIDIYIMITQLWSTKDNFIYSGANLEGEQLLPPPPHPISSNIALLC